MNSDPNLNTPVHNAIEISIRLAFLLLLVLWCLSILAPFAGIVLWAIILAIAAEPFYNWLLRVTGSSRKWSTLLFIVAGLLIILIPSLLFIGSLVNGARTLSAAMEAGSLTIPPPSDRVAEWPLIGESTYSMWSDAATNLEAFLGKYTEQLESFLGGVLETILGIGTSIIAFILSTIIAGILLATRGTDQFSELFFRRLLGENGREYLETVSRTIRNVTKGVIGVAFIQAILMGIGFILAGIPYAGIWTLLAFIIVLLQLPGLIIILPAALYLFSVNPALSATLWTIYLFLAGMSDNVLKPVLLGKGAPVPMLVIFLGVIGGFILSGFVGLFTGAIVLSIGYKLFLSWVKETPSPQPAEADDQLPGSDV